MKDKNPQIALVYDKVNTPYGGAEKVLTALHSIFPDAPLYTSVYGKKADTWSKGIKIQTSWLQNIPYLHHLHQLLTPLFPIAFESFDLSTFDIVISITSSQAKGVITKPNQLHICYMLTPTRYLFSHQDAYMRSQPLLNIPGIKQLTQSVFTYLKNWDVAAAHRPDYLIPISTLVADRITKYYHRPAQQPIYPTLSEVPDPQKTKQTSEYALVISRLVPYKRIDIAVHVAVKRGERLVIVGNGTDFDRLTHLYSDKTYIRQSDQSIYQAVNSHSAKLLIFLGNCSDQEMSDLFTKASLLLMIGEEDFGITALEAAVRDVPVIIHQKSGVAELLGAYATTVADESVTAVNDAWEEISQQKILPIPDKIKERMTTSYFASNFNKVVYDLWHRHQHQALK